MGLQSETGPPEMVAASDQKIRLEGDAVTVEVPVPKVASDTLRRAVAAREKRRLTVSIDDIQADTNPGVVYAVYLNRPAEIGNRDAAAYHIGNIALFGIERMNDPEEQHAGEPGFRHTFDVTEQVKQLDARGEWAPDEIRITIEPLFPEPPPGREDLAGEVVAEQRRWAAEAPVTIGRVSVFVE